MLVSQLYFQNLELQFKIENMQWGEKVTEFEEKYKMQNFKIKRAPWKNTEVNSMRNRKREEGPVPTPILSYASLLLFFSVLQHCHPSLLG